MAELLSEKTDLLELAILKVQEEHGCNRQTILAFYKNELREAIEQLEMKEAK